MACAADDTGRADKLDKRQLWDRDVAGRDAAVPWRPAERRARVRDLLPPEASELLPLSAASLT
jgi:hypothetical protein